MNENSKRKRRWKDRTIFETEGKKQKKERKEREREGYELWRAKVMKNQTKNNKEKTETDVILIGSYI